MSGLPRYSCHKVVQAAKIAGLEADPARRWSPALILDVDGSLVKRPITWAWYDTHGPSEGGYLVVYEPDGYESFSPAPVFEAGYTRLA